MSVYLGDAGHVQLKRTGEPYGCILQAADVDAAAKRFSIDFDPDFDGPRPSPLITGDEVEFRTADGISNLILVAGSTDASITRWVHVDNAGGIRLFSSYAKAVNGSKDDAVALEEPAEDQRIIVDVVNLQYNCVAQMQNWELTTQRETVDTTILGEEFRQFYDQGLVSGQGSISAIWDYRHTACLDDFDDDAVLASYFSQLVIRFREGSKFKGIFTVYKGTDESVWYESDCVCTSVGMNFAPGQVIGSTIQFVTTGQIQLKQGTPPGYLLQDNTTGFSDQLLLETESGSIELEYAD